MISYREALQLISQEVTMQPVRRLQRDESLGYVAAKEIRACLDVPPFNNSSMDGFALRSTATVGASENAPLLIKVAHTLAAGDLPFNSDQSLAVEIMTGAKMPLGYDVVVPIEQVRVIRNELGIPVEIEIKTELEHGDNVRYSGDDFKCGQLLASPGTRLHAGHIAAMASAGVHEISVFCMPEIEFFTTGKEVSDAYDKPLNEAEIYNANAPYLRSCFKSIGIPATYAGNIADDEQTFIKKLSHATKSRIVISSGAVSMGKWDFIPEVLKKIGARIIFHRVSIKPGKPILFAVLKDGRYFFGLPGNPVSTAVGLKFFVMPLIRQSLGMPKEIIHYAEIRHEFKKHDNLRNFLKAKLDSDDCGKSQLTILDGQQSFKISSVLDMNCWAIIGENENLLADGDHVAIASMDLFPIAL